MSVAIFLTIIVISIILNKFLTRKFKRYLKIFVPKEAIITFFVFFIIACVYINYLNQNYEKIYKINDKIAIQGVIKEIEKKEYNNKYIIDVKSINNKEYNGIKFLMYSKDALKYGDKIEFLAEYKEPECSRNFKGFSYKDYLKQSKIYGTLMPINSIRIIENNNGGLVYNIAYYVRNIIEDKVNQNLSDEASQVFLGILLGEKNQISNEISTYFKDSNMAHILAVSGAHVSYIMLTISLLLNKTGKRINGIITIIVLMFFMIIANFTPSVERACTMAIIAIIGKLIYRKPDVFNNLAISSMIILLNNPYILLNLGFQLSFLGTLGIVLLSKKMNNIVGEKILKKEHKKSNLYELKYKLKKYILNTIIISACVQLLIAPIILINFNIISLNFLISGIVATPIFASIVVMGIISLITGPIGVYLFPVVEILVNLLVSISRFISNISFLKITFRTPNIIWIISYYIILIVVILLKEKLFLKRVKNKCRIIKRTIIVLLIICILTQAIQDIRLGELNIYFIDVGQGDSTLIVTPCRKTILIDGGGAIDYDIGEKVLVPYLLDRGIMKIDYLMVSHFDNDHCGGLMRVLEVLRVKNLLISKQSKKSKEYENFINLASRKNINVIVVKHGNVINIENNISIQILYPSSNLKFDDLNNNAIVAKFIYKDFSMLFTGDVEKEAEEEILRLYDNEELKSTVLKIAHHGSKTSSTEDFLNKVKPKVALIGVGKNNNFGHPNKVVLERLEKIKCKIYRTDQVGEITINTNGRNIEIKEFVK